MKGNLERAEMFFLKELEIYESAELFFYLGLIANQKKNLNSALNYFHKSLMVDPDYGNSCNELGVILLREGRYSEAVYWLKKSVRSIHNDARHISFYNLATLYKIWNRPERSLQYLYKAIDIAPEFQEAISLRDELLHG